MTTEYIEVKRLEEIKNHLWFDDEWNPVITMLGGFHQGEPNTEKDIRGPVSKDINFNPLDLVEAIRNKQENPDDIFHQMLLLSAETIGEIDRETRELEMFKKRYKAIEKDMWDEMIHLLKEEQDELYKNVELAFGVCMVDDEGLITGLIEKLENWNIEIRKRSIDTLKKLAAFSRVASWVIAEKVADIIVESMKDEDLFTSESTLDVLINFTTDSVGLNIIIEEKAIDKLVELLKNEEWYNRRSAAYTIGKMAEGSSETTGIIEEKATENLIKLLEDDNWHVSESAAFAIGIIVAESPETAKVLTEKAIVKLVELLKNEKWQIRRNAVYIIGKVASGSPETAEIIAEKATDNILELLKKGEETMVIERAFDSLGDMAVGSQGAARIIAIKAIDKLMTLIWNWDSRYYEDEIVKQVTDFLEKIIIKSAKVAKVIAEKAIERNVELINNKNRSISLKSISVLGKIAAGTPTLRKIIADKAANKLVELLENTSSWKTAASTLGKIAKSPVIRKNIADRAVNKLVELLEVTNFRYCYSTAENLEMTIDLMKLIISGKTSKKLNELHEVRLTLNCAAMALGEILVGSPELTKIVANKATNMLIKLLDPKNWDIWRIAIPAIGRIAAASQEAAIIILQRGIDRLVELLKLNYGSRDIDILISAADALSIIATTSPKATRIITERIIAVKLIDKLTGYLWLSWAPWTIQRIVNSLEKIAEMSPKAAKIVAYKTADKLVKLMIIKHERGIDSEGCDAKVLEKILKKSKNRIIKAQPTFQNFLRRNKKFIIKTFKYKDSNFLLVSKSKKIE